MSWPWPPGAATGTGPWPGTDPGEAARLVLGELGESPHLPHLPELPARGVGADATGRTAGLLVDLHLDLWPSGWRLSSGAGRDEARARQYLVTDLDALEEAAQGYAGMLKLQLVGPWTLAATLELTRGEKVLSDAGAVRDLTTSLAEGLAGHLADVGRRLPASRPLAVQLDEPLLPAVLAGAVPTASGWSRVPPVEEPVAEAILSQVLSAGQDDSQPPLPVSGVRCPSPEAPVALIRRAGASFFGTDVPAAERLHPDILGEAVDGGMGLFLGLVPTAPDPEPAPALGASARRLWNRLALDPVLLPQAVVVTPAGGLAGLSPGDALAVLRRAMETAVALAEEPE